MSKKQSATINWIHILNEQTVWLKPGDLADWFAALTKNPTPPSADSQSDFVALLNHFRAVLQDLHFGRPVDLQLLSAKAQGVRLAFQPELSNLPLFRAVPTSKSADSQLKAIGDTVLIQFCAYVGEVLAGRPLDVARCEGLFRDQKMKTISPALGADTEPEVEWRCEIPILVEEGLQSSADVHRCADFFAGGKGKFCSDACRFTTFQLMKQLKDPEYLAEKQRRYRAKKK